MMMSATSMRRLANVALRVFSERSLLPIPQLLQVGGDGGIQPRSLSLLFTKLRNEPGHLFVEGLAVVLDRFCSDVAAGRQDVTVMADVLKCCALAEAGDILIFAGVGVAAPRVVRVGDSVDVFLRELAVGPIHHATHLAGIDEQHVTTAVTEPPVSLVPGQEPQARGNLSRVEQLSG